MRQKRLKTLSFIVFNRCVGIDTLGDIGCFGLTELGYGNNAVEMETTAIFDPDTKLVFLAINLLILYPSFYLSKLSLKMLVWLTWRLLITSPDFFRLSK